MMQTYARWVMSKIIHSVHLFFYYCTSKHSGHWGKGYRLVKEHEFHVIREWSQLLPLVKVKGSKKVNKPFRSSHFPVDFDVCLAFEISFCCPHFFF